MIKDAIFVVSRVILLESENNTSLLTKNSNVFSKVQIEISNLTKKYDPSMLYIFKAAVSTYGNSRFCILNFKLRRPLVGSCQGFGYRPFGAGNSHSVLLATEMRC